MFDNLINAIIIFFAFILASYIITIVLGFFERAGDKKNLVTRVIKAAKLPLRFLAVLLGMYFAAQIFHLTWSWKKFDLDMIFYILVVLLISYGFSRMNKAIFSWHVERNKASNINITTLIFLRKTVSVIIYLIGLLVIFQKLGIAIGPFLAGLGVAGIAIALGLQQTLQNVFAAAFFVLDKTFNIGDYVQLDDGTRAKIVDISWRSTKLKTIDGNIIILPNSNFVNQKISSFDYKDSSYSISIKVGVPAGADLDKVEAAAVRSAKKVINDEKIMVKNNEPRIRFFEIVNSVIGLNILMKVDKVTNERRVKSAMIKEVIKEFKKENIEIK